MAQPFLAEIRLTSFSFPPKGYALCNGQLLPINQNQALFSLLGTTYGGNGQTTFALPNLRGRAPLHTGPANSLGASAGVESVAVTTAQMPSHDHVAQASAQAAGATAPQGNVLAKKPRFGANVYGAPAALTPLAPASVGATGGGQPHTNMQPYLVLSFVIAMVGAFPSRN